MFFNASPSRQDSEMREARKQFFIHGNGPIMNQFEPLEGRMSYYQTTYKGQSDTLKNIKIDNSDGCSTVFGMAPNLDTLKIQKLREAGFSKELYHFRDKKGPSDEFINRVSQMPFPFRNQN